MVESNENTKSPEEISIARKPIFTSHRRLWGYELLCVGDQLLPGQTCHVQTTAIHMHVASLASAGVERILNQGQKIMIDFDERSILTKMPYALPPQLVVVQVNEQIAVQPATQPALLDILEKLRSDGYFIAVHGFSGSPEADPLYELASFMTVPITGYDKDALADLVAAANKKEVQILARQVNTAEQFENCREAGIHLFEGAFFKNPDTLTIHRITSSEVSRLKLIQRMEEIRPDIDELSETLESDASISFRLLSYLNSSAFGFPNKIKSINHAIRLMGWNKFKYWLRMLLISDMGHSPAALDLLQLSAQRARFLETIGKKYDFWGFEPESLHLFGLFSLMDVMLASPMATIVQMLPIDNRLKDALCGDPNNAYYPLIELVQCLEEGRWEDAETVIRKLNLDRDAVTVAFREAVEWATRMVVVGDLMTAESE